MSEPVIMWKIRDKQTGLFAPGGAMGYRNMRSFTKKGKTWSEKRYVTQHMANNQNFYREHVDRLEIVKMVLTVDEVVPLGDELEALMERLDGYEREKKKAKHRAAIRRAEKQKQRAEKELESLSEN